MTEATTTTEDPVDKAAAAAGATADTLSDSSQGGQPTPPKPQEAPKPKDDKNDPPADGGKPDDDAGNEPGDPVPDPEPKPAEPDEPWESTGDDVGDSVLSLLQESGVTRDVARSLMLEAVKTGDVSKIDKDALIEAVGKSQATLIMAGSENYLRRSTEKANTIITELHTSVGGKENWAELSSWAKTNVPETELAEYRDMIDAGGAKARFAAKEIQTRFNADEGNTSQGAPELSADGTAPSGGRAINRTEYVAELDKAYATGASDKAIAEIKAARQRGRTKGL